VDVASEDEVAGFGDAGKLGVSAGVVEPGGALEDYDSLFAEGVDLFERVG